MIIKPNPTAERIENDMTATPNEIRNQATVATTIRSEWFHILCSANLREVGPAERAQLLNHFLLTVSLTKERLLRFGTRYVLMDRLYECRTQGDEELASQREQWLQIEDPQVQIKEVMTIIERDVRRLETTVKEIKEYMAAADCELKSNRQQLEAADILTKSMQALGDKLRTIPNKSSDDKVEILHEKLTALEMTQKPRELRKGESLAIQVNVNKGRTVVAQESAQVAERKEDLKKSLLAQVKERDGRKATASEEIDEQYFGRSVLETSETKQKAGDRTSLSSVEKAVERQEPSEDRQNQLQRKITSSDREPIAMAGQSSTESPMSHKKAELV
nr:chromosome segregation protein SMC [Haemonchus contortus]